MWAPTGRNRARIRSTPEFVEAYQRVRAYLPYKCGWDFIQHPVFCKHEEVQGSIATQCELEWPGVKIVPQAVGQDLTGSGSMATEILRTISPSTNQAILTRESISSSDLALLPAVALQSFTEYRLTSLGQRQAIVKKALRLISDKQHVLARELTEQIGRPIAYSAKEISTAVARGEYLLKISGDALKDTDGESEQGFKRYIRKAPIGPVLIIFAWNVGWRSSSIERRGC